MLFRSVPRLAQASILLNSLIYTDKLTLYSTQSWPEGLPKASDLLACCMCGMSHKDKTIEVGNLIREKLVFTGLLNDKIRKVDSKTERKVFSELIKDEQIIVFSKSNPVTSGFVYDSYVKERWHTIKTAKEKFGEVMPNSNYKLEDIAATGRAFVVTEALSRVCEMIALHSTDENRLYATNIANGYNRIDGVANELRHAIQKSSIADVNKFKNSFCNFNISDPCPTLTNDLESFDIASKEQVKYVFGNAYTSDAPMFMDIFFMLNNIRRGNQLVSAIDLMLSRVNILHDFVVNGEIPKPAEQKRRVLHLSK